MVRSDDRKRHTCAVVRRLTARTLRTPLLRRRIKERGWLSAGGVFADMILSARSKSRNFRRLSTNVRFDARRRCFSASAHPSRVQEQATEKEQVYEPTGKPWLQKPVR